MTDRPDEQGQPEGSRCSVHNIALGPNGECVLCRRGRTTPALNDTEESKGSGFMTWLLVLLLLAVVGATGYMYINSSDDDATARSGGPSLDEQISILDERIKDMNRARNRGELGPQGLNRLERLEKKRAYLEGRRQARDKYKSDD